ncbi:hypothetical protein WJX73_004170 [Symbiochloris irregularis]|uniref:Prolyl endopeptidase-like n=1 Tax=Symbiochloris irregularis TaxID=706552 RepID=A0AAW1PLY5_9CHLO
MASVAFAASGLVVGALGGLLVNRRLTHRRLKKILGPNLKLLNKRERQTVLAVAENGGQHLFSSWPPPGIHDQQKRNLVCVAAAQLSGSNQSLEAARQGVLQPPKTIKKPFTVDSPLGLTRDDPYYWLRDDERKDPEILEHLEAENAYTKAVLADTEELQKQLVAEMRARIQEADESVPVRESGYYYYSRTLEDQQYRVHCRRKVPSGQGPPSELDKMDLNQPEEIILDENAEAAKHSFYILGGLETSPDHKLIAYAEDVSGGEKYTIHVRELATGKQLLTAPITNTSGNLTWALDNRTLFYVTKDKIDRPYKLWRHRIGTDPKDDIGVFQEDDEQYNIGVGRTRDDKLLLLSTGSAITSDEQYLPADQPEGNFKMLLPRKYNVEYDAYHRNGHVFLVVRDEQRPNSELLVAPLDRPTDTKVLLRHQDDVKLEGIVLSKNYVAVFQRKKGLQVATIYSLPKDGSAPSALQNGRQVEFDEPAYELGPSSQGDFDSSILRLGYNSLTTPATTLDLNMDTGARETKKVQPVLGGFDSNNYKTERRWAKASDGTGIPYSLVYRQGLVKLDGSDPLLLNGYGSYEICNDPGFSRDKVSLLDRGFIFVLAHVRGGGEMGRNWYEKGKYEHKKNTFTDFIAVAEHLIDSKMTSPERLCIEGRSAGGLLIGAVLNMRPDLFSAALAGVPFVDVVTTMLDDSIPLTTGEWEEWGNPQQQPYYDIMLDYSPVDNVKRQKYPNILVTAGLWDPRVAYWEPAKWVAKLRAHKTDNNLLLMKCNLGAGHFSESGRFDRLKETAIDCTRRAALSFASASALTVITTSAAAFAADGTSGSDDFFKRLEDRVSEFTLPNGLHFLVLERHTSPVVSCHTYADVGAFDEPNGQTGIAHLLEHMAFKGSERIGTLDFRQEAPILDALDEVFYAMRDDGPGASTRAASLQALTEQFGKLQAQASQLSKPNEFGAKLKRAGAVGLNAATSADATRYYVSLPTNALELWFAMEAERFQAPVFRELYSEKLVVAEERRSRIDNAPLGLFAQAFCKAAFDNAYSHPVIGWPEDVARIGRRELQDFFATHYTPKRLTIAIVGDVVPEKVEELAVKYFGSWGSPAAAPDALPPSDESLQEPVEGLRPEGQPSRIEQASPAGPCLLQAYYRPGLASKDALALDVIGELLSGGRTARLQRALVDGGAQQALGVSCSRAWPGEKHGCCMVLQAVPTPGTSLDSLDSALHQQVDLLAADGPTPKELRRIAKGARMDLFEGLQSNSSMASNLCSNHVLTKSWRNLIGDVALLQDLQPQDVREVASRLFAGGNCFTGVVQTSRATSRPRIVS